MIVAEAWKLARRDGLAAISLRDLADRVDLRQPSLYAYFDSKLVLYDVMFADGCCQMLEMIAQHPPVDDPCESLVEFVECCVRFATEDVVRHQLLFQRTIPGFKPSPQSRELVLEFREVGRQRLAAVGVTDLATADIFTGIVAGFTNQQVFNDPRGDRWILHVRRAMEMFLADLERRSRSRPGEDPSNTNEGSNEMGLVINQTAPDFEADTTQGRITFHEWIGDSWAVLFSHPKDFTPVCTTELGYMAKLQPEFERRNVKVIGLSVDATKDHEAWADDIEQTQGARPNYPIIGDADFAVSKLYGMLPADTSGDAKTRTPADNQTVRNVFVIGPDKKVKLILVYPMTTGRNFDEVLRVIDSLQLTAKHRVATPVNWKAGEDVIIAGSVSNDEAKKVFGDWKEPKPYIRIVPQPN